MIASGGGDLDAEKLGRGFITELRRGPDEHSETPATDLLRWGADDLDDETLWRAVVTIVGLATPAERWGIGDGLIDESVAMRPELRRRWRDQFETNPGVRAVYEAMWEDLDACGLDRGWWTI